MINNKVKKEIEELVNVNIKEIKKTIVEVNSGIPIFEKKDYQLTEGIPNYFKLDNFW